MTTSGVLLTVLFGVSTLATAERSNLELRGSAGILIVLALIFFVGAAASAILTNLPLQYQGPKVDALRLGVRERWDDSGAEAERMTSLTRLKVLESAKNRNAFKSWALVVAMTLQIVAIALVGAAIGVVLL